MKKLSFFIMGLLMTVNATAVNNSSHFEHIGIREGLSNGFVNDMTFDGQGFLWVATNSGLNRIAGKTIVKFLKTNSPISCDEITVDYYNATDNTIWAATRFDGISIYDINTGEFRVLNTENGLLSNDIADIIKAHDGGIWILNRNRGVQHYDNATGEFINYTNKDYPEIGHHTRSIVDDGAGKLYVAHFGNGMSIVDTRRNKIENFQTSSAEENGLISNFLRVIFIDSRQNIWVGTNKGVLQFNPSTKKFTEIPTIGKPIPDNIHDVYETRDGTILLSYELGEITCLQVNRENPGFPIYEVTSVSPSQSALSSPNVRKVLEDSYGNLWVGHYSTGVDFIHHDQPAFSTDNLIELTGKPHKIYGIGADKDGNIWLGGENTLALFSNGQVVRDWDLSPYISREKSVVAQVFPDSKGNIWLGVNDVGVIKYNVAKNSFEAINLEQPLDVQAFWEDEDGTIWIGTEIGPLNCLYSYSNGLLTPETEMTEKMARPTLAAILRDSLGRMWFATTGKGLFVYNDKGERVVHMGAYGGLPSSNINSIYQDSEGYIWLGTAEGLVRMDDINDLSKLKVFDHRNGLKETNVRSVCEDLAGNIWVSTFSGISCLKKGRETFVNYDYRDGLPDGGFSTNSAAVAPDGTIYWGSIGGLCSFNRLAMNDSPSNRGLRLVSFESVDANDMHHLIPNRKGIYVVPADENSIKIQFTVDNYAEASQIEYSYKLEGIDKEWQFLGNTDHLAFKSLPGGRTYTLRIRARLKNGEWNDHDILSIKIKVEAPIWLRWYAILGYVIIGIAIIIFIMGAYRRRLRLHNRMEMQGRTLELERKQRQDEQDLNNERMRFYTNIAHELRTPLTLIIGPLEDLIHDSSLTSAAKQQVKGIHDSSIRLLNLINQIMEFRKTETQNKELQVSKGSISDVITEIGLRYKELYKNDKVEFQLSVEKFSSPIYFDREIVTTIVNNFVSNAIKYTANGHIRLSLDAVMEGDERYARISVEDTGYGIDADVLPHIYERYFQANGKHQASGTGIGLALVKNLSDIHKGILKVDSTLGVGSTFSFLINMNEVYPEAIHKDSPATVTPEVELIDERDNDNSRRQIILVVEDNPEIREYIANAFKDRYNVITASDGNEGLELAMTNIPDMVISDIMMPGMDGIQLCRTLKEDLRTSHIPVILLTAKDTTHDKEVGYESGADSYLTKPFSARLLKARVANLIERQRRLMKVLQHNMAKGILDSSQTQASIDMEIPQDSNTESIESNLQSPDNTVPSGNENDTPKLNRIDREFLERFEKLNEENLSSRLDMPFLTDKMNMSHSTLYRKLKSLVGMSPAEYVKQYKLKRSIELLRSQNMNVSEVAYHLGFNSPEHFRSAFRDTYGMSPTQYIKKDK